MKNAPFISTAILIATLCGGLTGCLPRPDTINPRRFVLSPVPDPATGDSIRHPHPALGVGRIQMPAYLLRSTLIVRKGPNEIEYLDNALWAEQLDLAFQRIFAANLKRLVPTDEIQFTDWLPDRVDFAVQVLVEQFDVDAAGRARLVATWRITNPVTRAELRQGEIRLEAEAASPEHDPQAAVAALNALLGKFSGEVAKAIQECAVDSASHH